tara:strand:+ start:6488 stop:7282 length:795 start_codon:yes stop_codon:yes gene_type:complete
MTKVTVVSALFDIDRVDGRKWDQYLKWFKQTLQLKVPMILFIPKDLQEIVDEVRGDLETQTIYQEVDDIPYYNLKKEIEDIIDSEEYHDKMSDSSRIECRQAMHPIINFSKFDWLKQAANMNHHKSDAFLWLDAGASRFFDGFEVDTQWPSEDALESLGGMEDGFLVQMNCDYYPDLYGAEELGLDYLWDNRSYVLGSLFGGSNKAVNKVADQVDDILRNKMIGDNNINNEQIALGYLVKKYPDDYVIYNRTNGKHMDLFGELS